MIYANSKHPELRRIVALRHRSERERTGLFFAEGVRFLIQAVNSGAEIEAVVVAPAMLASIPARKTVHRLRQAGVNVLEVTPGIFCFLSLADSPQGVGVVVRQQWLSLKDIRPKPGDCWLVLDTVNSSGNFGTMVRTLDAAGARGVILLGNSIDPHDPGAVRASMGAIFSRPIVRTYLSTFLAWKERYGVRLIGTTARSGTNYRQVSYRGPIALYMGCEQGGITPERQKLCDAMARIPMTGSADSLNVAVAAGILLFEAAGQRTSPRREGTRDDTRASRLKLRTT